MSLALVIVDDAAFIREALKAVAEKENFTVVGEAADGDSAVPLILEKKPDVVILDLVLPNKNGVQVAIEVLEQNATIKILACSTESEKHMVLKALEAGCIDFIAKPFSAVELVKKIRKVASA